MLGELKQFIYWTHVGREGALHFKELLRQKKMAESLSESVASGMSVEKTQKMIKRLVNELHVCVCPTPHSSSPHSQCNRQAREE